MKIKEFIQGSFRKVNWCRVATLAISLSIVAVLATSAYGVKTETGLIQEEGFNYRLYLSNFRANSTTKELDHVSLIMDLAVEFHFDPAIVMIVDHYSKAHVDPGAKAWSIIRDPDMVTHIALSLIKIESNGNTFATSNKKAYGLTQLLLPTAKDYEPEVTRSELYDQETNIRIFFQHFERLLDKYDGNVTKVLHGWNRGEGTVDRLLSMNIDPANGFSDMIYRVAIENNRGRLSF